MEQCRLKETRATIVVSHDYLYIPVKLGGKEEVLKIYIENLDGNYEKVAEFQVPVNHEITDSYPVDFYARFPVKKFTDKTLLLKGNAPEAFWKQIFINDFHEYRSLRRPLVHFTARTGWINDPNGLIYENGYYHLFFQHNPFNTIWNNMSWGHAVSKDLLHWTQKDDVLFPDEHGMIFSGSAVMNTNGLLDLPSNAMICFYTAAGGTTKWSGGKLATQRMAYSLNHGETLTKLTCGMLNTVCEENRDPYVFWHEETKAYIMCLWLENHDFGIFRSKDLENWEQTDRFTMDQAWECPELIKLYRSDGSHRWIFTSADGYYFWGEFDGYRFSSDGIRHTAYMNKAAYAAQTFSGIGKRTISIPWLRILKRDDRVYAGAMGIPREWSIRTVNGIDYVSQNLVSEFDKRSLLIFSKHHNNLNLQYGRLFCLEDTNVRAILIRMKLKKTQKVKWSINESNVTYDAETGVFTVDEETLIIGSNIQDFTFIIDDVIFEVMANYGIITGSFELRKEVCCIKTELDYFTGFEVFDMDGQE